MGFFTDLFHREKHTESVVLISIREDSISGAYAYFEEGKVPAMLSIRHLPIETHRNESPERAMLRTLEDLGNELLREGAPALLRASGSGRADGVLISVDTRWQETALRTDNFERREPFALTETMVHAALKETRTLPKGMTFVDESIISAVVNGYEVQHPYGKMACRASVTVLASFVDTFIAKEIMATFRGLYHTKRIHCIAGTSLRYQAIRAVFPHERKPDVSSLRQALDAAGEGKLWIPGNPPRVVPVLASHLSGLVRQTALTPPDLALLLMVLYYQTKIEE